MGLSWPPHWKATGGARGFSLSLQTAFKIASFLLDTGPRIEYNYFCALEMVRKKEHEEP